MYLILDSLDSFESAVLIRFLYRSGLFYDLNIKNILVDKNVSKYHLAVYGRLPPKFLNKYLSSKDNINIINTENVIVLTMGNITSEKSIESILNFDINGINKYNGILITNREYPQYTKKIELNITGSLLYDSISFFYICCLRNKEFKPTKKLNNKLDKISRYIAKKILHIFEPGGYVNVFWLNVLLIHVYKRFKLIPQVRYVYFNGDSTEIIVEIFNKKLKNLGKFKIIWDNNYLRFPVPKGKHVEYREFYIDFTRNRVWITNNYYIEQDNTDNTNIPPLDLLQ